MSDVSSGQTSGQTLLAQSLRELIAIIRDTRRRLLVAESAHVSGAPTDEEALHDFRVALRRSRTFLRLARIIWNTKQLDRIDRDLRYIARTTGTLRDDEVLRSTLAALPQSSEAVTNEVNVWLEKRARRALWTHRSILDVVREGSLGRDAKTEKGKRIRSLDVVLDKLDALLDKTAKICSVFELAQTSVATALGDVQRGAQSDVHDIRAMHALRIREKRLRYTVELFANELGDDGARLASHATKMQRRLGDLHDVDDAMETIRRARGLSALTRRALLEALHVARSSCVAKVEPHLTEARQLDLPLRLSCNDSSPNSTT